MDQPIAFDAILHAGAALGVVRTVDNRPFVIVPKGYEIANLQYMMDKPARNKRNALLGDEQSFIAFVNRQKTENTDLYYGVNPPRFKAIFNGSRAGAPDWEDDTATFQCECSPSWLEWESHDREPMNQEAFSLFIERNLPDIIEPEAASLLEIVTTLQAKKKVNFVSGLRLSNGANQFTYEEQIDGSAAKGNLQIPESIFLGMPVFVNGVHYRVEAKFRYRIHDGRLSMWYELVRPHVIVEDAVSELREKIAKEAGIVPLHHK
ncbi:MAG TPA: DUF2303 family protein [Burkholderiaceae bacterium]|nr:DUF2303 family protein [Burkholderiaceae bacterium]